MDYRLILKILGNLLFVVLPCIMIANAVLKNYCNCGVLSEVRKVKTTLLALLLIFQIYFMLDFYCNLFNLNTLVPF